MSRNMNRCSQRRTTVARDRGRPVGLATATGLRADRARPCQPLLSRASGERRSVHERRSRAQAQRARKFARAFWWSARTASATPPGLSERKHSSTEITQHFLQGQVPAHVASKSSHDVSTIAQKLENTAHPVFQSGLHSTSSEDVDLDLVSLAPLSEAWYSGALTPNCSMIYGDGNSERQRSWTEITLHASEGHFPVHMASKSFHEDLDRDTPTSKCIRERENVVHPVNGCGIHSTAHVDEVAERGSAHWSTCVELLRDPIRLRRKPKFAKKKGDPP